MSGSAKPQISNISAPFLTQQVADERTARVMNTRFKTFEEIAQIPVPKLRWLLGSRKIDDAQAKAIIEFAFNHIKDNPPPFDEPKSASPKKRKYTRRRSTATKRTTKPISGQECVDNIVALQSAKTTAIYPIIRQILINLRDLGTRNGDLSVFDWTGMDLGLIALLRTLIGRPLTEKEAHAMLSPNLSKDHKINALIFLTTPLEVLLGQPHEIKTLIDALQFIGSKQI